MTDLITRQVDPEANIIFGTTIDPSLDERVRVTVIATGFDKKKNMLKKGPGEGFIVEPMPKNGTSLTLIEGKNAGERRAPAVQQTFSLDYEKKRKKDFASEDLDIPTFLRRGAE